LFFKIKNIFENETYNALVIFKNDEVIYAEHPSIYYSALQLDLYPNNVNVITINSILNQGLNLTHLKNIDVLIYYNLDINEKNYTKKKIKEFEKEMNNGIKKEFDFIVKN